MPNVTTNDGHHSPVLQPSVEETGEMGSLVFVRSLFSSPLHMSTVFASNAWGSTRIEGDLMQSPMIGWLSDCAPCRILVLSKSYPEVVCAVVIQYIMDSLVMYLKRL